MNDELTAFPHEPFPHGPFAHEPQGLGPEGLDLRALDPTASTDDRRADSLQPIAGVGLDLYARIVRSIALMNHDLSMLAPMAALHGVGQDEWVLARQGWNERIATDDAVNYLFRELYDAG